MSLSEPGRCPSAESHGYPVFVQADVVLQLRLLRREKIDPAQIRQKYPATLTEGWEDAFMDLDDEALRKLLTDKTPLPPGKPSELGVDKAVRNYFTALRSKW